MHFEFVDQFISGVLGSWNTTDQTDKIVVSNKGTNKYNWVN